MDKDGLPEGFTPIPVLEMVLGKDPEQGIKRLIRDPNYNTSLLLSLVDALAKVTAVAMGPRPTPEKQIALIGRVIQALADTISLASDELSSIQEKRLGKENEAKAEQEAKDLLGKYTSKPASPLLPPELGGPSLGGEVPKGARP